MEQAYKIRPAHWLTQIVVPVIVLSALALLFGLWVGENIFRTVLIFIFGAMALLHTLWTVRLRNRRYAVPMLFYLFSALTFAAVSADLEPIVIVLLAVSALLFFLFFMLQLTGRKIKWRQREMLELAARVVDTASNGYTDRPYPLGKVEADRAQLRDFAQFLLKHTIAYPVFSTSGLVLVLPRSMTGYLLGLKKKAVNETSVAFSQNGEMSVRIAEKDYSCYREQLTFDQLCASLGRLMLDFLELYKEDRQGEIIDRLNGLRFIV